MPILASLCLATALTAAPVATETATPAADSLLFAPLPATFRVQVQAGAWIRLNNRPAIPYETDQATLMLTWEVSGFRWDGRSTTWGLGVRGALDDFGFRLGPKALVRFPLGDGGTAYVQVAGSYYLFKGDSDLDNGPCWSLETEIAPLEPFAFVLGLESLSYNAYNDLYAHGIFDGPTWTSESVTNVYAGIKFSQWTAVAMTAILFAAAAATVASNGPY